uniref:Uncharacterized protein n=1 Tax=Cannabis sativa TaxID=3483 RepID=A0A803Q6A6_CANSA
MLEVSAEIDIDLVNDLRGPPQVDKESRRKVGMVLDESGGKVGVVSIRESNKTKTQTCTRIPLRQPLSSIEEYPEAVNKVSAAANGIF